eukprot:gnl/MRDRNA2_/MRDRNA2_79376_c0_seq1.p1 gnl/MRDRNA2_/MRDRNA2_79376_c0~~gnl/MRDRNA2_/MRDRNA2_79376_c0_seq1.p1  ORF type:complete len:383 (+),score=60.23 gnl/MRDRNA2_/MRDRNA2_79376_c0_seq1:134-1282(+)
MLLLQALAAVWAIVAGVSVTLQLGGTIALNERSASSIEQGVIYHTLRSLYVTQGGILVGALWLGLLAVVMPGDPPKRPQRLWSVFGGIVTLPSFVTTPAAQVLGLQLVLMLLLLGMVGAAIVFDVQARQLHLGAMHTAGLVLLFTGVLIELLDAIPMVSGHLVEVVLYVVACFSVGVLFAVQSKMNVRLSQDLGSSFRSATWSNATAFAVGVLLLLCVRYIFLVKYEYKMQQWWIWLLVGMQSAFYALTLATLPKMLGYSSMFVLVLSGKLASSAVADTLGAFQPAVPLSILRCASVGTMLIGAILYSSPKSSSDQEDASNADVLPRPVRLGKYEEVDDDDIEEAATHATVEDMPFAGTADRDVAEDEAEIKLKAQAKNKIT